MLGVARVERQTCPRLEGCPATVALAAHAAGPHEKKNGPAATQLLFFLKSLCLFAPVQPLFAFQKPFTLFFICNIFIKNLSKIF